MYIGYQKNENDEKFIAFISDTKEKLLSNGMTFIEVCYTQDIYSLYDGRYLKESEIVNIKETQKKQEQINILKKKLDETDYIIIKHAEGLIPEDTYEKAKKDRATWRKQLNELES